MAINIISVQYDGGLLPVIILLTQGYYHWGTRLNASFFICFLSGVPAWRLMEVYSITVGFSPVLYC